MATETKLKGKNISPKARNDIQAVTSLMVDIIRRSKRIWRNELNDWQRGRALRYNILWPQTYLLQSVYEDSLLDGHLTGITENRTLRTINKVFGFFDKDGKMDENLSKFIQKKQWFRHVMKWAHESNYREYSLIFIDEVQNGEITKVKLIDRGHVIPDANVLLKDVNDRSGLDYSLFPEVLLYADFYKPAGLLEKAVPYTILKRHSWGSWDEFEELFGVPIRIAKIASQSDAVKKEVAGWLEEMGSAAYGVFPVGTEVEIKENSKADAFNVFYQKINALDREMSKLILHQTMTTDAGSSKSQGEVHEQTLEEVIQADELDMVSWLNGWVVPAMRYAGYSIPEGYTIGVLPTLDVNKQILIDGVLMQNGFIPTKEYVERTYGMEIQSVPGEIEPKGEQPPKKP